MEHDASRPNEGEFRLQAMLFSTLHDYPGLSIVSSIYFRFKIIFIYIYYVYSEYDILDFIHFYF